MEEPIVILNVPAEVERERYEDEQEQELPVPIEHASEIPDLPLMQDKHDSVTPPLSGTITPINGILKRSGSLTPITGDSKRVRFNILPESDEDKRVSSTKKYE